MADQPVTGALLSASFALMVTLGLHAAIVWLVLWSVLRLKWGGVLRVQIG